MKYLKIILFWTALSGALGLIIKYSNSEVEGSGIFIILMFIGLFMGSINALLSYFGSKSKRKIFAEAMIMYNGKVNINGETELIIKNKKIILDYKLEQIGIRAAEYIIANIDLTDFEQSHIEECKKEFEIIEKNNRIYAVIYSSWGYKGEKFKKRVENKIELINSCVKGEIFTNTV